MPSIKKVSKQKVMDFNPRGVQDPTEVHKRSPGKFDQRVFMEQQFQGMNATRSYYHISNLQQKQALRQFDQQISSLKNRHIELKTKSSEYCYLRVLRTAFDKEWQRRKEPLTGRVQCFNDRESSKRANTRHNISVDSRQLPGNDETLKHEVSELPKMLQTEQPASENTRVNQLPYTQSQNESSEEPVKLPTNADNQAQAPSSIKNNPNECKIEHENLSTSFLRSKDKITGAKSEKKRTISPSMQLMLENLSYEIMTRTLPIQKLKRILPDQKPAVVESYPILSNHRRSCILPLVKKTQHHLEKDMIQLKERMGKYFEEEFPLNLYKYIPNEKPRKVRLIKAISRENLRLPHLPGR